MREKRPRAPRPPRMIGPFRFLQWAFEFAAVQLDAVREDLGRTTSGVARLVLVLVVVAFAAGAVAGPLLSLRSW